MTPLRGRSTPSEDPAPRSEEERERARLEREARRAGRDGSVPAAPELPPAPPPAAAPPAAPVPAAFDAEPTPTPTPTPEPARAPAAPMPEVFPAPSDERLARLGAAGAVASPAATPADGLDDDDHDDEPALGTRRARGARSPGVVGGTAVRSSRRRRPGRGFIVALVALLIVGAIAWFANALFQPFHGSGHGRVVVEIPPNSSSSQIGKILEHDGAVSSGFFFALRARLSGKSSDLRPGRYVLQQDMPYSAAITALSTAPKAAKVVSVTIPEGLSIREAGPHVKAAGLRGSYLSATAHSSELTPRFYGAPKATHSLEGFLFPDTYQLRRHASVNTLVHDQVVAFRQALKHVDMSYARSKHLTVYDVLTIASMVERESASPSDRKKIAAVIYNRLHDHTPLGIDATLRFALNDWDKPLTLSQLHTDTPYNTRIHLGLPPTPIGSPGLAAIQAAAHPAHVNYLFYVANPDGCGGSVFSSTNAKFQRDVARYQAALAAHGGHVPACKKK